MVNNVVPPMQTIVTKAWSWDKKRDNENDYDSAQRNVNQRPRARPSNTSTASLFSRMRSHLTRIGFILLLLHEFRENKFLTLSSEQYGIFTNTTTRALFGHQNSSVSIDSAVSDTTSSSTEQGRTLSNLTFFYNLYLHPRRPGLRRHAMNIVAEQLSQIGRSHVMTKYRLNNDTQFDFHYYTIGREPDHTRIKEVASKNGLRAIHGGHVKQGFEDVTLQPLHDYCRANPTDAVIYVHSKGAFNAGNYRPTVNGNWNQDDLRKLLTYAATHEACLDEILNNSETCQLCGLLLQPLPSFHVPGNMWAAQCSYVQHLAPPATFSSRTAEVVGTFHSVVKPTGLLTDNYYPPPASGPPSVEGFGLGRFALEHWVGSNPLLVQPCHISPLPGFDDLTINRETLVPDWEVKLVGRGNPGFPLDHPDWHFHHYVSVEHRNELMSNETQRKKDYFLLPGFLYKWKSLYGLSPPPDSWVWSWFPDGDYWKAQLSTHPLFTTNWTATGEAAPISHTFQNVTTTSKNMVTSTSSSTSFGESPANGHSSNLTFFYNLFVHPSVSDLQQHAINIFKEQLAQLSRSHVMTKYRLDHGTPFLFHYNTIGQEPNHTLIEELASTSGLHAIHGRHVAEGYEDTTLQQLYEYCRANPTDAVIYVHDKGAFHAGNYHPTVNGNWNQDDLRKLLTYAATHEACLDGILDNSETCQLCGLLFQPIPSNHIPGNMWAARCSYIQHLAPPATFIARLGQVVEKFQSTLQPAGLLTPSYYPPGGDAGFGLGRYALEHWVASNPRLVRPCHISPMAGFDDLTINRETLVPDWKVELVGNGSPGFPLDHPDWHFHHYISPEQRKELMSDEAKRRTEYFFLPGYLYKWKNLYGRSPPLDSWVWSWFPDGEYWKSQLSTHPLLTTNWFAENPPISQMPENGTSSNAAVRDVISADNSLLDSATTSSMNSTSSGQSQASGNSSNLTFFYNLFVHPNDTGLQQHSMNIFEEQMRQIGRSHVITKYRPSNDTQLRFQYYTVGKDPNHTWIQEVAAENGLHAVHGRHVTMGHEDVTLQPLYDHCLANPTDTVIYVHSKGAFHIGNYRRPVNGNWNQDDLRKLLTFAATHEACLEGIFNNNETCQVCGLVFELLPSFHFPGNMWVARCSYIQHLLPPATFSTRMEEVVDTFYSVIRHTGLLAATYFPLAARGPPSHAFYGRARYALEHWVGSNPLLVRPCHISPLPGFDDLTINRETMIPDWKVELVGKGNPGYPLDHPGWHIHHYAKPEHRNRLMSDETKRRKEYFLLPGFLYKWKSLYGLSPPPDSWVWNWFPDGEYWKSQLEIHPLFTTNFSNPQEASRK